jgi:hypothetical protein
VTTSISYNRRDDHGNYMKSRSMSRNHHFPEQSIRRAHTISGIGSISSFSFVRRKRRMLEVDILQGELRKIKPPTSNGEHRK